MERLRQCRCHQRQLEKIIAWSEANGCEADDVDAYRSIEPMPNGLYSLGWGYAHCDRGAMTMFGIWAEVWGSVTGHRCASLKADGVIQQYQTREEAEAEATRLAREHNGNPHRTACFRDSARPLPTC